MQNLKIRVSNEAESKEAQELFFELGLRFVDVSDFDYPQWLAVIRPDGWFSNYSISKNIWHTCNPKEITLPELRAMVNPMKEYLVPDNGGYRVAVQDAGLPISGDWLEIPEGAIRARFYPHDPDELEFENAFRQWWYDENRGWFNYTDYAVSEKHSRVVWQREQDEPFLTPECTLNDQYAEIEAVRQASAEEKPRENNHYFIDVSDVDEVDFYEIAKRYNVTDPAIQHILKKCLAIGNRGHKDLETDLKDILKTAKRALQINGFGE